jgi:hypothetical protein
MTQGAFDLDVTRVAQEKLHSHERSVVDSINDGITRLVIRVVAEKFGYNPGPNSCQYFNWSKRWRAD